MKQDHTNEYQRNNMPEAQGIERSRNEPMPRNCRIEAVRREDGSCHTSVLDWILFFRLKLYSCFELHNSEGYLFVVQLRYLPLHSDIGCDRCVNRHCEQDVIIVLQVGFGNQCSAAQYCFSRSSSRTREIAKDYQHKNSLPNSNLQGIHGTLNRRVRPRLQLEII